MDSGNAPHTVTTAPDDWPHRPLFLATIGAVAGLVVALCLGVREPAPWQLGLAAFAFFAAFAAGFVLQARRLAEGAAFALGLGAVLGFVAFTAARGTDADAAEGFAFAAGVFFSLLATPLFQARFHRSRFATPYRETHFHVWTDAIASAGALAFTLLAWLLLWLMDSLFALVGIDGIEDLITQEWFFGPFLGATFGLALGVIGNNIRVLGAKQNVALLVLSLLAIPFALAIAAFLAILLASGGQALWAASDDSTPVLLTCALASFVFANAVIRDDDAERSGNRLLQLAAAVLAGSILPLGVFAAIGMGIRIDQHGLAPERIWAVIATAIACAYGLAYWVGLVRGRRAGWSERLRRANLHLAAATCVLALLLALPLVDYGAISARNQVARLAAGEVSAEDFDYAALRWDFGASGEAVLARLAEREGDVGRLAQAEQAKEFRTYGEERFARENWEGQRPPLRFAFTDPELRQLVSQQVSNKPWMCAQACIALDLGVEDGRRHAVLMSNALVEHVYFRADGVPYPPELPQERAEVDGETALNAIEVREVRVRQIYIGGKPAGAPFE